MDSWVIVMMMSVSIFLGSLALMAFLWAIKNGQFDDQDKMRNAVKFDGEDELNDAAELEKKQKKYKKDYRPAD